MKRIALIPARGGSKALPRKNLAVVAGSTLLARAVRCALDTAMFDAVVVSTDDQAIADEGVRAGAVVPFLRPADMAADHSPVVTAIQHAIAALEARGAPRIELIALLEPTSPLRTPTIVREVVTAAERHGFDAALSVSEVPLRFHPLKQFVRDGEGRAVFHHGDGAWITNRQELSPTFIRNGMCYAVLRDALDAGFGVLGSAAAMVVVDGPVVNIDDAADLELARSLLEGGPRAEAALPRTMES